jgi:hypothetical protein
MNYFDSDMSKSTNTVVYFDWKKVVIFTHADNATHNLCCQIRAFTTGKSVTCTGGMC